MLYKLLSGTTFPLPCCLKNSGGKRCRIFLDVTQIVGVNSLEKSDSAEGVQTINLIDLRKIILKIFKDNQECRIKKSNNMTFFTNSQYCQFNVKQFTFETIENLSIVSVNWTLTILDVDLRRFYRKCLSLSSNSQSQHTYQDNWTSIQESKLSEDLFEFPVEIALFFMLVSASSFSVAFQTF